MARPVKKLPRGHWRRFNASLTALPTSNVTEPGSQALPGLGIASIGIARRRKQTR
jgi:hypothetical protein